MERRQRGLFIWCRQDDYGQGFQRTVSVIVTQWTRAVPYKALHVNCKLYGLTNAMPPCVELVRQSERCWAPLAAAHSPKCPTDRFFLFQILLSLWQGWDCLGGLFTWTSSELPTWSSAVQGPPTIRVRDPRGHRQNWEQWLKMSAYFKFLLGTSWPREHWPSFWYTPVHHGIMPVILVWLGCQCGMYQYMPFILQPVPKAYRKCCVKCKIKCSHLKLTQKMLW